MVKTNQEKQADYAASRRSWREALHAKWPDVFGKPYVRADKRKAAVKKAPDAIVTIDAEAMHEEDGR